MAIVYKTGEYGNGANRKNKPGTFRAISKPKTERAPLSRAGLPSEPISRADALKRPKPYRANMLFFFG